MEEKISKINEPNHVPYDPSSGKRNPNVFVQFNFEGENYHRFRNKHESPYPTEIFYNSLVKEFKVKPSLKINSDWDKEEGRYEIIGAGIYDIDEEGKIYLSKNGGCLPGPKENILEDLNKEGNLELILKNKTNLED
jgi:hypothetical protein